MKKEPMENDDRDRDSWLGAMIRSQMAVPPDACVDAETLAAWAEGALETDQASAVERHASNCSRCMALLASLERIVPPAEETRPAWTPGSLWRWLVPLTAAATAVAIWVAVPERPITQVPVEMPVTEGLSRQETPPAPSPGEPAAQTADLSARTPEPAPVPPQQQEAPMAKREAAPPAAPLARDELQPRRDERRERANLEAFSAPAAVPPAPAPAPAQSQAPALTGPMPSAPPSAGPAAPAADAAGDSALATLQRQSSPGLVPTSESTALTNSLVRWRVMGWTSVERSIDGGRTWIKTSQPPGVTAGAPGAVSVVSVRATDALRAVITTSDGREFYTTNGGIAWERLQGNSPAPF